MTIARRKGLSLELVAAPAPSPPAQRTGPGLGMGLRLGDAPAPDVVTPAGRLRRCTFRRIDPVAPSAGRASGPSYEVMCLYGGAEEPLALGDIDAARPICNACRATGVFRPDEA